MTMRCYCGLLLILLLMTACGTREIQPPDVPTPWDINDLATAIMLTENAPPAGYDSIIFPQIDSGLPALSGWRYEMMLEFDGTFAQTTRPAQYFTRAEVSYNQVESARRVMTWVDNDLQQPTDPFSYEAVRLGADAFIVRDGSCLANADDTAQAAADLSAGVVLGGVNLAEAAAKRAVINDESVFRYAFLPEDLVLASVALTENSRLDNLTGELWFSPDHDVVIRFYVTVQVENVLLLDNNLPVSGTLRLRYDVFDIGTAPNLSIPYGC